MSKKSILEKLAYMSDQTQFDEGANQGMGQGQGMEQDPGMEQGQGMEQDPGMDQGQGMEQDPGMDQGQYGEPSPEEMAIMAAQSFIGEGVLEAAMQGDPNAQDIMAKAAGSVAASVMSFYAKMSGGQVEQPQ